MNLRLSCSLLLLLTDLASAQVAPVATLPAAPSPAPTIPGAVAEASPTPFLRYDDTGPYHVKKRKSAQGEFGNGGMHRTPRRRDHYLR